MHKSGNILDRLSKGVQARGKDDLHQVWMAETRADVEAALTPSWRSTVPSTPVPQTGQRPRTMLIFYDYPAEYWKHLRTTNPIEFTFANVRLRHRRTKGSGDRKACLAMVFKLVQRSWPARPPARCWLMSAPKQQ